MYVGSSVGRRYLLAMLAEGLLGVEAEEDDLESAEDEGLEELSRLVALTEEDRLTVTGEGEELLFVAEVLKDWLRRSPQGRLRLGEPAAGEALGALVFGWSTTAIHALSRGPLSLLELTRAVDTVSTEVLVDRVSLMEITGLVERRIDAAGKRRYAVTDWLRQGIAPLAAAARLERHFPAADTVPPDALDVGAAFFLTAPLIELPAEIEGTCRLEVEVEKGGRSEVAGVTVRVDGGRIVACEPSPDPRADAFVTGSALDWFDTLVRPEVSAIRAGGREAVAPHLLDALHETLFGAPGTGPGNP